MSAPSQGYTSDDRFVEVKERRSRAATWITIVVIVLLVALAGVTGYMGLTMTKWTSHAEELEATVESLKTDLANEQAHADDLDAERLQVIEDGKASRADVSTAANDKAHQQDYQGLYSDGAFAMSKCAKERVTQIGYVRNAYKYVPSSLASYEDDVDSYCAKVIKSIKKIGTDDEGDS